MNTIIYLLQVSACTGIFYGFYFLLLRRLTFFTLNRWYLLASLLLSFVIPAINLPIDTAQPPAIMQPVMYVNRVQIINEPIKAITQAPQQVVKSFDWATPVKTVYIAMAAISLLHLVFTLLLFFRRSRAERLMQIGNVKVLKGNSKQGNSSFLNVIFVNDDELEPAEVKQIIAHEMLHVQLLHSADRIIARLVQIVLWFNPFAYCYIRSIEENHEFEVDRIIAGNADKNIYATLLFKLSVSGQSYLMHSFSKVPLKSRIAMLFNKPTSNMKKIIYLLIAPVVLISCLAFANLKAKSPDTIKKHLFYTFTKSTTADGVALETRRVFLPNNKGAMGSFYKVGEKVAFIVDGKVFSEHDVNKVEQLVNAMDKIVFATGEVKNYRGKTDKSISAYNSYFEFKSNLFDTTIVDTNISIHKYRQIDRLWGKRNPYPNLSKSPDYIRNRKIAERVAANINTYKITGITAIGKLPQGYTMTNGGDEFVLTTLYGSKQQLDGKLKAGDEVQVKGMAIAMNKKAPVLIVAESITKSDALVYKVTDEDRKDTTAFLFEGNRVRYMYGKITDIQKYPNGKWKSAVVEKENGYKVKFYAKPTAPSFAGIKEGDEVTFRFVHEYRISNKQFDVKDWVSLSNNIKDYGTKNPDFFFKFYEKI